jgi:hypothetical protein
MGSYSAFSISQVTLTPALIPFDFWFVFIKTWAFGENDFYLPF